MPSRNTRLWLHTLAVGMVLVTGACRIQEIPTPERVDVAEAARAEMRATLEAFRDARIAGDVERLTTIFTDSARIYEAGEPDVVGMDAIVVAYATSFVERPVAGMVIDRERIDIADGGMAYEFGTFAETPRENLAEASAMRHARYVIRWRRMTEGRWAIDRMLLNYAASDTLNTR